MPDEPTNPTAASAEADASPMQRLVSCPFCGAPGEVHSTQQKIYGLEDTVYFVACTARECGVRTMKWYPAAAAVAAWNRRAANS